MTHFLTPRMRPLSPRRSLTLSVLDVGSAKVVCLIAQLKPAGEGESLPGRTHVARVIGIGHARSAGLKGGAVVNLDEAERAIRSAVDAAERMARVEVRSVIVNLTGGRLGSVRSSAGISVRGGEVTARDVDAALAAAASQGMQPGRAVLHTLPTGFTLDGQRGVTDPEGLIGRSLGVDMHVVSADAAATRNLMLAVERCHLDVEAVVSTPYASGLACLVDDEADMGVALIDMGASTTSFAVFAGGALAHADAIAVGGYHVTMDVARGLSTRIAAAERLKTLYGSAALTPADERELISVPLVDEFERDIPNHAPKSQLTRIIQPRVEEILELVRDRLRHAGFGAEASRRVVLTGGASQLNGMQEAARRILSAGAAPARVRAGRPLGVKGLPEAAKGPAFAAAVGLLVYPQVAFVEHFETRAGYSHARAGADNYLARVGRWIKDSF
ncbi:cell division protein FtsA [Camelimonas abortus]|uniref:Cell division protein FtsA n=1 Tax=Camelimonas abortus TaxID=1017184 RepID=A0ABV7LF22_9HYPH